LPCCNERPAPVKFHPGKLTGKKLLVITTCRLIVKAFTITEFLISSCGILNVYERTLFKQNVPVNDMAPAEPPVYSKMHSQKMNRAP
jgi:hypothetical protein